MLKCALASKCMCIYRESVCVCVYVGVGGGVISAFYFVGRDVGDK